MPQPTLSQVHINRPLTNISVAYIQDQAAFVFNRVFPVIPVDKKSDLYFIYQKDSFLRDEAQLRAPGTESAGTGYGLTTSSYNAEVWAIHDDVPDQIVENSDQPLQPMADSTTLVTQKLLLRQENLWVSSFFKTGVWGTDQTVAVQWSDQTGSDPVNDIKTGIQTILSQTGLKPNKLTLGYPVFKALEIHPDLIDRVKYGGSSANPATVSANAMAEIFGLDEVLVAQSVQATANENNGTQTYGFVLGKNALLSYSPSAPGIRKPSAGYSFFWRGVSQGMGTPIKITDFYMPWLKSTRVEGEVAVDMHAVSTDCGYFFPSVVA